MVEFLLFREVILFFGLLFASYTDLKSGIIPDRLNYFLIAVGILFNLVDFNFMYFIIPILVFAFFALLYYLGKIGGGDVKLFTATALVLPFVEGQPLIVVALFYSAIISVVFLSVYYVLKYVLTFGLNLQENRAGFFRAGIFAVVLSVYFVFLWLYHLLSFEFIALFFIPLAFGVLFIAFQNGIQKHFFLKTVPLTQLEEDEVIARDFLPEAILPQLHFSVKGIITYVDKEKLQSLGVSEVPVYRSLPPFAPFFLIGCVFALLFPHVLSSVFWFALFP